MAPQAADCNLQSPQLLLGRVLLHCLFPAVITSHFPCDLLSCSASDWRKDALDNSIVGYGKPMREWRLGKHRRGGRQRSYEEWGRHHATFGASASHPPIKRDNLLHPAPE